jgi:hypothetical protein
MRDRHVTGGGGHGDVRGERGWTARVDGSVSHAAAGRLTRLRGAAVGRYRVGSPQRLMREREMRESPQRLMRKRDAEEPAAIDERERDAGEPAAIDEREMRESRQRLMREREMRESRQRFMRERERERCGRAGSGRGGSRG